MSPAARIRKCALGPAPQAVESLAWWVSPGPDGAFLSACEFCDRQDVTQFYLAGADEVHARTFLLLVAEALK